MLDEGSTTGDELEVKVLLPTRLAAWALLVQRPVAGAEFGANAVPVLGGAFALSVGRLKPIGGVVLF